TLAKTRSTPPELLSVRLNAERFQNFGQVFQHVFRHFFQAELMLPPPMIARSRVVNALRPGVGDLLTEVRVIGNGEVGNMPANFSGDLFRTEAHGSHIV